MASGREAASGAGWIDRNQLVALGEKLAKSTYGQYLLRVADGA